MKHPRFFLNFYDNFNISGDWWHEAENEEKDDEKKTWNSFQFAKLCIFPFARYCCPLASNCLRDGEEIIKLTVKKRKKRSVTREIIEANENCFKGHQIVFFLSYFPFPHWLTLMKMTFSEFLIIFVSFFDRFQEWTLWFSILELKRNSILVGNSNTSN